MTQYSKKNISGDAGEYLVAYLITKKLGWPCRLLNIDLGVDGEFEVLDDKLKSDGDIVKFQVKAVAKMPARGRDIYVSEEHIKYWKNFSAPIIVCCVDHSAGAVYWQPIYQTEAYHTSGASRKITFKPTDPKIDSGSKDRFRLMVMPPEAKNFAELLQKLNTYIDRWNGVNGIDGSDDNYLVKLERTADDIAKLVKRLEQEKFRYPWRFSPLDQKLMDAARAQASWVKRTSQEARVAWNY